MKRREIALIPGDGIGPEVTSAAVEVIRAAGIEIEWRRFVIGAAAMEETGGLYPEGFFDEMRRIGVALKGPVTTPIGSGFSSVNVGLRKELDLYASLRPVSSVPGVKTRHERVDLVVVRENTEGLYSGIEHEVAPGIIEGLKVITAKASEKIARFAFDYALRKGRVKITFAHKASVMPLSDGLFRDCARAVANDYPEIKFEETGLDNLVMRLVLDPSEFDMILLENLYGDIVSDLASGLVGGLGLVPGANIGKECAVFEPVHGSAPDIAGLGIANPTATILSGALLLEYIGEASAANRVRRAVLGVIEDGKTLTGDLGGRASAGEFVRAVVERVS